MRKSVPKSLQKRLKNDCLILEDNAKALVKALEDSQKVASQRARSAPLLPPQPNKFHRIDRKLIAIDWKRFGKG